MDLFGTPNQASIAVIDEDEKKPIIFLTHNAQNMEVAWELLHRREQWYGELIAKKEQELSLLKQRHEQMKRQLQHMQDPAVRQAMVARAGNQCLHKFLFRRVNSLSPPHVEACCEICQQTFVCRRPSCEEFAGVHPFSHLYELYNGNDNNE